MAAAIQERFGVEPELVEGSGGIFDVKLEGRMVFSKHETGRFPETDEILTAIAADGA